MSLSALNNWYQSRCDGDWEHQGGLTLESLDNPGWLLTVQMHGAPHGFAPGSSGDEVPDDGRSWLQQSFENDTLQIAGSPDRLDDIIAAFLGGVQGRE